MKGKKAYELARKGLNPKLNMRNIVVHSIKLNTYGYPILKITCKVSSGTYIRSLAHDLGFVLGVGAHVTKLRRTKIGSLSVDKAISLDNLSNTCNI